MKKILVVLGFLLLLAIFAPAQSTTVENTAELLSDEVTSDGLIFYKTFLFQVGDYISDEYQLGGGKGVFKITLKEIIPPCQMKTDKGECFNPQWQSYFVIESDTESEIGSSMWVNGSERYAPLGMSFPAYDGVTSFSPFVKEIREDSVVLVYAKSEHPIVHDTLSGEYKIHVPVDYTPPKPVNYYFDTKSVSLKVGESFSDQHTVKGEVKGFVTQLKNIEVSNKCVLKNGKESCADYSQFYMETKVTATNSSTPEVFEFVLSNPWAGETEKHFFDDEYYVALGVSHDKEPISFHFGKKIWLKTPTEEELIPESVKDSQAANHTKKEETGSDSQWPYKAVSRTGITVKAVVPVEQRGENFFIKTGEGTRQLKTTPEKALEKISETEKIDCPEFQLKEKNGGIAYDCTAVQKGKLFGIMPIEYQVSAEVSAEQETEAIVNKPWWSFLVFK